MLGILDDRRIEDVLRRCSVGHIGCREGDDVYVVPISYVYADRSVYGHCAGGRKLTAMRRDPDVCFEAEWESVVATGRYEHPSAPGPTPATGSDLVEHPAYHDTLARLMCVPRTRSR